MYMYLQYVSIGILGKGINRETKSHLPVNCIIWRKECNTPGGTPYCWGEGGGRYMYILYSQFFLTKTL